MHVEDPEGAAYAAEPKRVTMYDLSPAQQNEVLGLGLVGVAILVLIALPILFFVGAVLLSLS